MNFLSRCDYTLPNRLIISQQLFKMTQKHYYIFLLMVLLAACKEDTLFDKPANAGNADLTKYVAIGDATAAGYADGGLYREAQLASFPNLLAKLFQQTGKGDFKQPLFEEGQENGTGYYKFGGIGSGGLPILVEVKTNLAVRSTKPTLYTEYTSTNQNLGVPNLRVADLRSIGYGLSSTPAFNPLFERLLPANAKSKSYLDYVVESTPTFFTLNIGLSDLLGFVNSGGAELVTPPALFAANFNDLLAAAVNKNTKGVVMTLPDPTQLGYLTAVPANSLKGPNNASVFIKTGAGVVRTATNKDLMLPIAATVIGKQNSAGVPKGFFPNYPLDHTEVLDEEEVTQLIQAFNAYNQAIKAAAKAKNIPVFDYQEFQTRLKNGITQNGISVNASYPNGNFYSLDAIHPTPRGNALLANELVKIINSTHGATFRTLDISLYGGIKLK